MDGWFFHQILVIHPQVKWKQKCNEKYFVSHKTINLWKQYTVEFMFCQTHNHNLFEFYWYTFFSFTVDFIIWIEFRNAQFSYISPNVMIINIVQLAHLIVCRTRISVHLKKMIKIISMYANYFYCSSWSVAFPSS